MMEKNLQLEQLIDDYVKAKWELDSIKKATEELNQQIKEIMETSGITEYSSESGATINYLIQKRESMNEQKLLLIAHENNLLDIIDTKEVINMDKLESKLYNGEINADTIKLISTCKEVKEIPQLRIKSKKGD